MIGICIIDDDLVSQFATRYCIEQFGGDFDITTQGSAEEALEFYRSLIAEGAELPEFIFLDLVMGDMDGWAFIEALEKIWVGSNQPQIYVLSAFANAKDRGIAKTHQLISGFFDKPLTKSSLEKVFEKRNVGKA
ncbi:MAG: response regulator [Flavobacteriaceae bacterium]|nr:response regulator [Flavobacteriaceae bacterium]